MIFCQLSISTATRSALLVILLALASCNGSDQSASQQPPPTGGSGGIGATGMEASLMAGSSAGTAAQAGIGGAAGAMVTGGIGGMESTAGVSGGTAGTGAIDAGAGGTGDPPIDAGNLGDGAPAADLTSYASGLDELFIDVPCTAATPLPLADGATCDHSPGTQHIEQQVTFGGDSSTIYSVTLRVRGIWEPTNIQGGEAPDPAVPFKIGGTVAPGNPIDYQQYSIEVSDPLQTYWLNDHQYVAHDIHKLDYEATLQVRGGATVTVIMNDGNERQIANWTEDFFEALPPYDTMPSPGQMLRLDVLSVSE